MEAFQNLDPIMQAVVAIIALALIWGLLQTVLKLAAKVFACGCIVIVLIGLFIALTTSGVLGG